ncbi:uncharacterized protein FFB20_10510 [Fusarium fujikuroi]|nr:uncharacterized protein FFB20_10510 [Fusarium fujikuroi]
MVFYGHADLDGISNPPERSQRASDELDTPLDTHVGPAGSSVIDASAATIATTSSCDDAINSPGVSDGIMVSVNPHASTAPDSDQFGNELSVPTTREVFWVTLKHSANDNTVSTKLESTHNRSIDEHRARFNAINEEISTGFEQMRRSAGEFRSSIRKVLNSRNDVHNQVKRVGTSITTLQNRVKYIEEIITAIQNQATGTVATVNALSGRVSEMEQTLTLVPALVRFYAQLREALKSISSPNPQLASNNGGNKRAGEASEGGYGKRPRGESNRVNDKRKEVYWNATPTSEGY